MRKLLILIAAGLAACVISCGGEKNDDAAAQAAKSYYDSLMAGNSRAFVRGMYLPDTIPGSYRSQLEANARMFMARMDDEHKGIHAVAVQNCVNDTIYSPDQKTATRAATAYLIMHFGDSLKEEIAVRMVEHEGRWLMK